MTWLKTLLLCYQQHTGDDSLEAADAIRSREEAVLSGKQAVWTLRRIAKRKISNSAPMGTPMGTLQVPLAPTGYDPAIYADGAFVTLCSGTVLLSREITLTLQGKKPGLFRRGKAAAPNWKVTGDAEPELTESLKRAILQIEPVYFYFYKLSIRPLRKEEADHVEHLFTVETDLFPDVWNDFCFESGYAPKNAGGEKIPDTQAAVKAMQCLINIGEQAAAATLSWRIS